MSKEALKIGVDLGTEKDEQCAVIILHYDGIDHIIYETHDKEQIEALNKIKQQEAIDNANPSEALECLEKLPYTSQGYGNWKEYYTIIEKALLKAQKEHKALDTIKKFIWVEDGKLKCGRYGDIEIELEEEDFESKDELDLLKEVLG